MWRSVFHSLFLSFPGFTLFLKIPHATIESFKMSVNRGKQAIKIISVSASDRSCKASAFNIRLFLMQHINGIQFRYGTNEELLPGFSEDFPYISSFAGLDGKYSIPWHWHKTVELFYIESGVLEYYTPCGHYVFSPGECSFVNANVLHRTEVSSSSDGVRQMLHIFDPSFISGGCSSRIASRYVMPLILSSVDILKFEKGRDEKIINGIKAAFSLDESMSGYEMRLRSLLSDVWMLILDSRKIPAGTSSVSEPDARIRKLLGYVFEHYDEKISIGDLSASANMSQRECYRIFREKLHIAPVEYINSYRIQIACQMLLSSERTITEIAQACGLGSSSYFGKVFKMKMGCTPEQFRTNLAR